MKLLDGKALAAQLNAELQVRVAELPHKPGLAVIRVGDDPASEIYVNHKKNACEKVGLASLELHLPADTTEQQLLSSLQDLNQDPQIHGILVQLPLPSQLNPEAIIAAIDPLKDIDGFHPVNSGYLLSGSPRLVPCTPLGIMQLLKHYEVPVAGKNAVVIGRSNIVGKPMAMLLLQANASVSMLHSQTRDIASYTRQADLIVVAAGKRNLLTAEMVPEGAVVVDVGMNRLEGRKVVGDVDFEAVAPRCSWITPVPGGVGPMTIAMLLQNTLSAYHLQQQARAKA